MPEHFMIRLLKLALPVPEDFINQTMRKAVVFPVLTPRQQHELEPYITRNVKVG
jgi:hypothetical protein